MTQGRRIGREGTWRIIKGMIIIEYIELIRMIYKIIYKGEIGRMIWYKIGIGGNEIKIENIIDIITISIMIPIIIVSSLVLWYSYDYMKESGGYIRYIGYIVIFKELMIILITGGNYIMMFIGWEGVGIISYLLITYWSTRKETGKAGIQAIIMNRIGDWGITIGIMIILSIRGNVEYGITIGGGYTEYIMILIIIGAMAKSAQIGLQTWLTQAMEARTRISALIHAATMVTAGIYVIIRSNMMINGTKIEIILIVLGSITAIMGGIMGIYKNDIKKIIAYSTISQLGYMIIGTGIGKYSLSIYHLINHAFIKALLFLGSGSIIHASLDNQDIRRKGGLFKRIPETIILMIIGSLSIMGIPNLTGYESKDTIIEVIGGTYKIKGIWIITIIGCGITGIYSIKILKGLMEKVNNGSSKKRIYESSYHILIRLYILGILSIIGGYLLKDLWIGMGTDIYGGIILEKKWSDYEELTNIEKWWPLIITIICIWNYNRLNQWKDQIIKEFNLEKIYNKLGYIILKYGNKNQKLIDKGILEQLWINGNNWIKLSYGGNYLRYLIINWFIGIICYIGIS